ncbi:hypothetical protein SAMN05421837_11940 [Amycolatopsis pretoriensis]|uniref:Uncharacterized protein n=1 Tax=Amycolatopsis pretoriensis TaxID=218821 RepID=A0A1H5RIN4_9PSEU|nr:hypothetical protein [Amycolatopsis pretoriensis]SEF38206.1 hypothetical protein SAMN05421837_11940 [Amycolatopsis pretoriensis]
MADDRESPAPESRPDEDELALRDLHERIVAHQRAIAEHLNRDRPAGPPPASDR